MNYFLAFLVLFATPSYSQIFEWVRPHPILYNLNPSQVTSDACTATNGKIFVARTDSVTFHLGSDVFGIIVIDFVDSTGTTLRSLQLGPKVTLHDLVADTDGNLFLAGSFMDTIDIDGQDTLQNSGGTLNVDPFLLCFDTSGSIKWKRNLSPGPLNILNLSTLALSPSGTVYYATDDFNNGKITELDSLGNDANQIILNGAKLIGDFKFDSFGNIYATGSTTTGTMSIGTLSVTVPEPYMLFIARINTVGQGTFIQLAHDLTFQQPNVVVDNDGNAYVAGRLTDSLSWGNIHLLGADWVYDFFLVKVDSTGTFQWAKEVPNPSGGIVGDFATATRKCLAYDPAGRIVLAGNLRGSIDWGNGVLVNNSLISQTHLSLVAFDVSGLTMWAKNITSTTFNEMHAVVYNTGNWYLTASHNAETGVVFDTITVDFISPQNMLLAKLNNNMTTGMGEQEAEKVIPLSFPNPTSGRVTLPEHWQGSGAVIYVYNATGQCILQQTISSDTINLAELKAGLYLLKMKNEFIRILLQ